MRKRDSTKLRVFQYAAITGLLIIAGLIAAYIWNEWELESHIGQQPGWSLTWRGIRDHHESIRSTLLMIGSAALAVEGAFLVLWLQSYRQSRRKNRRRGAGVCHKCRYPLIGITSHRCPECGTAYPG